MRLLCSIALLLAGCAGTAGPESEASQVVDFRVEQGALVLPLPVTFATGQVQPSPASEPALRHVVAFLAAKPAITLLRVEVHADAGDPDAQAQTEARALAVVARLRELSVDGERLLPVGFGGNKPVADGSTPDGRSRNRRVEFRPAALRGRPIGGLPVDGGGRVAK